MRFLLGAGLALVLTAALADAQSRRRPPSVSFAPIGLPDQAEGARILESARQIGFGDSFYLEFELRLLPRVGADTRLPGRWFGTHNATGPVTRLEILPPGASPELLIIQGGEAPGVWRRGPGDRLEEVAPERVFAPIAGSQVSAADLQTPFLRWRDFTYEGMVRSRGRPTHVFLLYPPEADLERHPGVGGVRAYIDTEYSALSQVQWVDEDGRALKTITAGSVRRVPGTDRWIVTTLDVRDDRTRDKSRLIIRAAALDVPLPGDLFVPAGVVEPADFEAPAQALRRFDDR